MGDSNSRHISSLRLFDSPAANKMSSKLKQEGLPRKNANRRIACSWIKSKTSQPRAWGWRPFASAWFAAAVKSQLTHSTVTALVPASHAARRCGHRPLSYRPNSNSRNYNSSPMQRKQQLVWICVTGSKLISWTWKSPPQISVSPPTWVGWREEDDGGREAHLYRRLHAHVVAPSPEEAACGIKGI